MADELNLGKASLSLEANLAEFERNMAEGRGAAERMEGSLKGIAALSKIAEEALHQVKMQPGQGARSEVSAEGILAGVRGIGRESHEAARALDRVHLSEIQAAESEAAGGLIDRVLNRISRNADEAKRKLVEVKLAGGVPGRSGVGVGPFGSGFGRVGVLGGAIGLGALTAPAAAPAAVGLLAGIPTLAAAGAGAVGTLALAFDNVGKAVSGDKAAFDKLSPAAQRFVQTLRGLHEWVGRLKQTAATSLFPGLTEGLRAALSPGTVNAISTAVAQLGRALGQAGAQWGRYFGSAQFQQLLGPLMQAGARSITVLSGAMLHLFDALGVIGKAAIPLMNWLNTAIAQGSRLADSWLRAQAASGGLARGMNEAKESLRLVGRLGLSLLGVVGALGRALYPVSKIAVAQLTQGLNALARMIDRNKKTIREIVGGALAALVATVKIATPIVRALAKGLNGVVHAMGGWKTAFELVIGGFLASKIFALGLSFAGLGANAGAAELKTKTLLGTIGRLARTQPIVIPILLSPVIYGAEKKLFEKYLGADFRGISPDVVRGKNPHPVGTLLHDEWEAGHKGVKRGSTFKVAGGGTDLAKGDAYEEGRKARAAERKKDRTTDTPDDPKPGSHAWYLKYLGYDPNTVFGKAPPFTKNTGASTSAIPAGVSHLEALASQEGSKASALGNTGKIAKQHLEKELADLQQADKLLEAKYKTAHGAARTQLFNALTGVENKIRAVKQRIGKAIKHDGDQEGQRLKLAVDRAKLAVENAKKGTHAYDQAVAAEEKALRAEIRYWDRRAHNMKLSAAKRDQAIRAEIADKHKLNSLLKPGSAGAAGANVAQFLSSFAQITASFAPNAFPTDDSGTNKTNTHLYEMKHELRHQTNILKKAEKRGRFPHTEAGHAAAAAMTG